MSILKRRRFAWVLAGYLRSQHQMVSVRASTRIARPAESVYEFVALQFFENYRRWSPEVQRLKLLSTGPIRVGFLARQVRVDHGRSSASTFRVTVLDRPSRIEFEEIDSKFKIGYWVEPAGDLVRLTLYFDLRKIDLHLRPFTRLIRSVCQDSANRAVNNIRSLIEAETPLPQLGLCEARDRAS